MKSAVFVNGVPASGKSTVSRIIAEETGWPLLALDTIKEAFFAHLGTGDRDYNRKLGKASYQAIFSQIADFPPNSTVIIDAWFGFQPIEVLQRHITSAGIEAIAEIWCHASPDEIALRYSNRLGQRSSGHLGADYLPELVELSKNAKPLGLSTAYVVNTSAPFRGDEVIAWIRSELTTPLD